MCIPGTPREGLPKQCFHSQDSVLQVYEYAVNTVLLSFCEDCEEHDGNAQFAPPLLLHALGQAQEHHDKAVAKANDGSVPLDSPTVRTQFITR